MVPAVVASEILALERGERAWDEEGTRLPVEGLDPFPFVREGSGEARRQLILMFVQNIDRIGFGLAPGRKRVGATCDTEEDERRRQRD